MIRTGTRTPLLLRGLTIMQHVINLRKGFLPVEHRHRDAGNWSRRRSRRQNLAGDREGIASMQRCVGALSMRGIVRSQKRVGREHHPQQAKAAKYHGFNLLVKN